MEDNEIVELYFERSERAIDATEEKYGAYCRAIARNLLGSDADAEECVNDTWLSAWNSIPPNRPVLLRTYLGKLVRRLSVSRIRYRMAEKRGGGEIPLILDELSEVLPAEDETSDELSKEALNRFLSGLRKTERSVFLCRYWYGDAVKDIAARFGFSESKVKSMLYRTREHLRAYLDAERENGGEL